MENKKIEKFSSEKLLDDGGIRFICPHDLLRFEKDSIHLLINIHSLAEMQPEFIMEYHCLIWQLAMSFYSLNRRYFDYKAGTGYFRDYIDDPSKEWRGSAAVRSNGTKHTRQWPKWPPHWNCLEEDAAPPWDPTFLKSSSS